MKNLVLDLFKPIARFIYYKEQRAKLFREIRIRRQQDKLIKEYNAYAEKIIVFLNVGADWQTGTDKISGGAISIMSLCEESRELKDIHNAEVIMCTFPKQHLLLHYSQFKNNTTVFRFGQLKRYFKDVDKIVLHMPEFLSPHFLKNISASDKRWLKKMKGIHINIMNQNIQLMPISKDIQQLKNFATKVTITTAHEQYCNQYYRELYKVPIHKFSVWISPEKYHFKKYNEKENLVILSPDSHAMRDAVINKLNSIAGLKVQVIQNLTYEEYKETISKAKWAITFGEGLDGYIIEPIFSGAIGFAVYNKEFFTPDFKELSTIYPSYEAMVNNISDDIHKLDDPATFADYQSAQYKRCAKHYSHDTYIKNIAAFYKEEYTFY